MHKILITSLRSEYDLIASSKLIATIHSEYPHSEIHILTYLKHKDVANLLNYTTKVHTISHERINQIFKSSIYHDGFGINIFMSDIADLVNTEWSLVINHSNDNVSAYLLSSLNSSRVIGTTISMDGASLTTDIFNEYLNNVSPNIERQPINLESLKRNMCSFSEKNSCYQPIKVNNDHYKIAHQNIEKIRNTKFGKDTIIVGISIAPNSKDDSLDMHSLEQIIEELEESEHYKPILILDKNSYQKEIVNQLNAKFNNAIISISAETDALPGILANLDFLISTNNKHLLLADAMEKHCVEITKNVNHQKINTPTNYSIVHNFQHFYNEIFYILNIHFATTLPVESLTMSNPIYKVEKDDLGVFYTLIQGPINIKNELDYHISRVYSYELLGHDRNMHLLEVMAKQCSSSDLNEYAQNIKQHITECSKSLLSTLRNLKNIQTSKENRINFIKYLDKLIIGSKENLLTHIPVLLFEAEVNNIDSSNQEQSFRETEASLYNLKNNFQKLTQTIEIMQKENKTVPSAATKQNMV